jgi:hypothetical protein
VAPRRLVPLSGIVFVVLAVVAVIGLSGSTPGTDDSAAKVASFYDGHSTRQAIAAIVLAASVPFLALFGVYLASSFRSVAGREVSAQGTVWDRLLVVGTALASAMILVTALVHFALADAANEGVAGDGIRALNTLDNDFWVAWNSGLGVMMLGAGATALTRVLVPRWLGWLAVLLGVLLFIPFADFFALLATLLWMIVVSILLSRTATDSRLATTAPEAV